MAYADREILNSLLGMEAGEYQSLNIRLKDISTMKAVAAGFEREIAKLAPVKVTEEADAGPMGMAKAGPMRMMSSFGSAVEESWEGTRFTVKTLDDYMGMISQLVGVLNGIALGLFFVLLLITMVGLVNTFRMIMIERTREIGTMRAVGVSRRSVRTLFLWEALFLSLKGSFYGITAAAVLGTMIRLIPFSPEGGLRLMLQEGHVRMPIEPVSIIAATLILSGAVLAATWMPARKASRVRPVDALRG
jgi:putative ABC transport system permease protein